MPELTAVVVDAVDTTGMHAPLPIRHPVELLVLELQPAPPTNELPIGRLQEAQSHDGKVRRAPIHLATPKADERRACGCR